MQISERKHLVSIALQFDTEQRPMKIFKQIENKPHKVTISVGYNNKFTNKASSKNIQSSQSKTRRTESANDIGVQKYYFQRKNQRSVPRIIQGAVHTQRKYKNGVTSSVSKIRQNSKSYRIHTIDLVEEDSKKRQHSTDVKSNAHLSVLNDITNKRLKFVEMPKNRLKKKSIINQSDLCDFTTGLKPRKQKQQYTLNMKHRKYNKVKTELQQMEAQDQYEKKDDKKQFNENNENLRSQKKIIEEILSKKINIKKKKSRFVTLSSKGCTLEMKASEKKLDSFYQCANENQTIHFQDNERYFHQSQQAQLSMKNKNFNNYIDFINKRKLQNKSGLKILQSCSELKSPIINHNLLRQPIPTTIKKQLITEIQSQNSSSKETKKQNVNKNIKQAPVITSRQKIQEVKIINQNDFDFSSIKQANNQSSFLSDMGKQQMMVNNFSDHNLLGQQDVKKAIIAQTKQSSMKKKNKRKQPKMSMVCRSELKQVFPQRFFI